MSHSRPDNTWTKFQLDSLDLSRVQFLQRQNSLDSYRLFLPYSKTTITFSSFCCRFKRFHPSITFHTPPFLARRLYPFHSRRTASASARAAHSYCQIARWSHKQEAHFRHSSSQPNVCSYPAHPICIQIVVYKEFKPVNPLRHKCFKFYIKISMGWTIY